MGYGQTLTVMPRYAGRDGDGFVEPARVARTKSGSPNATAGRAALARDREADEEVGQPRMKPAPADEPEFARKKGMTKPDASKRASAPREKGRRGKKKPAPWRCLPTAIRAGSSNAVKVLLTHPELARQAAMPLVPQFQGAPRVCADISLTKRAANKGHLPLVTSLVEHPVVRAFEAATESRFNLSCGLCPQ